MGNGVTASRTATAVRRTRERSSSSLHAKENTSVSSFPLRPDGRDDLDLLDKLMLLFFSLFFSLNELKDPICDLKVNKRAKNNKKKKEWR